MKFSIGDKVLLKRTGEEGVIIAFLSKDMIEVEVGSIRFPVYADEIDHPYLKWFTEAPKTRSIKRNREIQPESAAKRPVRLSQGIYLAFYPQFATGVSDDIVEAFRIHLLNETADTISFSYDSKEASGNSYLRLNGTLQPYGAIYLHSLSLEVLNAQPRFHWSFAIKDKHAASTSGILRIRPAHLIRYMNKLLSDGEPSFTILLAQDAEAIPPKPAATQEQAVLPRNDQQLSLVTKAERVLDLHPGKGEDESQSMSDSLRLLEQKLHAAYIAGFDSMTVIHGIGDGVLRQEAHRLLRDTEFVSSFGNEWMPEYGWGATKIFFQSH